MSHADLVDQIMMVMEQAFDPEWGEAWNYSQVASALTMPNTFAILVDETGRRTGPLGPPAAGFVMTRHAPGEEELLLIAVGPDHRRKGLGKWLIEELARDARSRGASHIFLEMRSNNPAERLYRLAGFEPIGKRKNYYLKSNGERLDAITFGLSL